MLKITILILIIFITKCIQGQNAKYFFEKASQSNTPHVLQNKNFQLVSGFERYSTKFSSTAKQRELYFPTFLFKYGTNEKLELQAGFTRIDIRTKTNNVVGQSRVFTQSSIGLKLNLLKQDRAIPTISLFSSLMLNNKFGFKYGVDTIFDYSLKFLFENKFNEMISLRYSIGVEKVNAFNVNRKFSYSITPIFTVSDNVSAFIEVHGYLRKKQSFATYANGGLGLSLSKKAWMDLNFGYNFIKTKPSKDAIDLYYGIRFIYNRKSL